MELYQWLCLIGVPGLGVLGGLIAYLNNMAKQVRAVKLGIQALLRAQMISEYNKYSEKGFAPLYARQNFENCWLQYHALGANGVMNDIHDKFMALPTPQRSADR